MSNILLVVGLKFLPEKTHDNVARVEPEPFSQELKSAFLGAPKQCQKPQTVFRLELRNKRLLLGCK